MLARAGFAWDGESISDFRHGGRYGESHRDARFRWPGHPPTTPCAQSATASGGLRAHKLSARSFEITIRAKNPLIFPQRLAPPIDDTLRTTFLDDGSLRVTYKGDLFPSHGLRIRRAGVDQLTSVTNDVSCLSRDQVRGPLGALNLANWLGRETFRGRVVVPTTWSGVERFEPSRKCPVVRASGASR